LEEVHKVRDKNEFLPNLEAPRLPPNLVTHFVHAPPKLSKLLLDSNTALIKL
jgi:hypothetical protein